MTAPLTTALDPRLAAYGTGTQAGTTSKATTAQQRARAQAEDLESVFVSTMFQSMFTSIDGDGPFGSTTGVAPWRSFLTEQYAKSFVKAGGIGLADQVYRSLLAQQETRAH